MSMEHNLTAKAYNGGYQRVFRLTKALWERLIPGMSLDMWLLSVGDVSKPENL